MAVFDANVLAALIVELPWSNKARQAIVEQEERSSPSILVAELASTVWQNVRAENIRAAEAERGLWRALSIVRLVADELLVGDALAIAIAHNHAVYDCLYLALARREGAPLITADRKLAVLAERAGVAVETIG